MIRRAIILALLALAVMTTVKAATPQPIPRWKIENPCFDNAGKWYTQPQAR